MRDEEDSHPTLLHFLDASHAPVLEDCITDSEAALRFLIDQVGADRVVLGSDWPFVRWEGPYGPAPTQSRQW